MSSWNVLDRDRLRRLQAEYDKDVIDYDECPVCGSPLSLSGQCSDLDEVGCMGESTWDTNHE